MSVYTINAINREHALDALAQFLDVDGEVFNRVQWGQPDPVVQEGFQNLRAALGYLAPVSRDQFRAELEKLLAPAQAPGADFANAFRALQTAIHANAVNKGFWDSPSELGTLIALVHGELSEALEGVRCGNPPDNHIPAFSSLEAELADAVIRILDIAAAHHLRLVEAILAKHEYNLSRPRMHGGRLF